MIPDQKQLRQLPSVNELLQAPASQHLIIQFSHDLAVHAIRTSLAQARTDILAGAFCPSSADLLAQAEDYPTKGTTTSPAFCDQCDWSNYQHKSRSCSPQSGSSSSGSNGFSGLF